MRFKTQTIRIVLIGLFLITNQLFSQEIYDTYGNKISDIPLISKELDIINTGNTGDIRIIRVGINGEQVTKMIFKD